MEKVFRDLETESKILDFSPPQGWRNAKVFKKGKVSITCFSEAC